MTRDKVDSPLSSDSKAPVVADFAFVAILRETHDALVGMCGLKRFEIREGYQWAWGLVSGRDGDEFTVVAGYPLDRENLAAATFVDTMLRAWTPSHVVIVDIGGGVQGREDLALGDVVVHTVIHYYDFHKIGAGGREIPRYVPLPGSSSFLRELSRRPAARRDQSWFSNITAPRPNRGSPTVREGELLSGGALFSKSPRLERLLVQHEKVLVVEMEGAGAGRAVLDSGLRAAQPEFLIVRGISDFCNSNQSANQTTRDLWRTYAAQAAAAHAVTIVREADSGRLQNNANAITAPRRAIPIGIPALPAWLSDETWPFEVRVDIDDEEHDVAELVSLAFKYRRLAVLGRAGAGKTSAVMRAVGACGRDIPVVLVARDGWMRDLGDLLLGIDPGGPIRDWRTALDVLLRGATVDVTISQLEALAGEREILLVVDGLNGGSAPVAARVLDILDEALRQLQSAAALVTDRSANRYSSGGKWTIAGVAKLERDVIQRRIDQRYGIETWSRMSEASRRLLGSPFFLDLALRGADVASATRSEALANFMAVQAKIEKDGIAETATATASAYAEGNRQLQPDSLTSTTTKALIEAGIVALTSDQEPNIAFTHELFGDYFASLHLAGGSEKWQPTGLDAISFSGDRWKFEGLSADTESFDAITLAAEQMHPASGDAYLRAVYDWNWRAAVDCLAATNPNRGAFSTAARLVVISLVSERRLDPVDGTRRRAERLLAGLSDNVAQQLAAAPSTGNRTIIAEHDFPLPWFAKWRRAFCRDPEEIWTEDALDEICDSDTLHGWTVSYVLKRTALSSEVCHRLEGIYRGLKVGATAMANLQASIRWRVIHSLAAGEDDAILGFLVSVLDDDPYPWVRWGAARSITEFAARSQREELTARAINSLAVRAPVMPEAVCREIAWVSQYHGAPKYFSTHMRPLLETLRTRAGGETVRARWDEWMERFDEFWQVPT